MNVMNISNAERAFATSLVGEADFGKHIEPRDWIDGYLLPRGKCTVWGVPAGGGKTTAALVSSIQAAYDGTMTLFGSRRHGRPLRCVLIFGEETVDDIMQKIMFEMPLGMFEKAKHAIAACNLILFSLDDYLFKAGATENLFDLEGKVTETGRQLFTRFRADRPDFVFIDTLSTVCPGDYSIESVARSVMRALNRESTESNSAYLLSAHLTKDAGAKIDSKTTSAEMISYLRGSGQLVSSARHVIVMTAAPSSMFENTRSQISPGDMVYAVAVKSNLGFKHSGEVFPVVRSEQSRTFVAQGAAGTFHDQSKRVTRNAKEVLVEMLPRIIYAASSIGQPFAVSGKRSIEKLREDMLRHVLPEGSSAALIEDVLKDLIADGAVVHVGTSLTGSLVLDVPEGMFARGVDPVTGKPPVFVKGAPDRGLIACAAEVDTMRDVYDLAQGHLLGGMNEEDLGDEREEETAEEKVQEEEALTVPALMKPQGPDDFDRIDGDVFAMEAGEVPF